MRTGRPRLDPAHARAHLSVRVHPNTLNHLQRLAKLRGLSLGRLIDHAMGPRAGRDFPTK